jgi:hypothetical protein
VKASMKEENKTMKLILAERRMEKAT